MKNLRRNEFIDMLEMAEVLFEEKDNYISCDIPSLGKLTYYPKSDKINVHIGNKWFQDGYYRVKNILSNTIKTENLIQQATSLVKIKEVKSETEFRNEFAGLAMQGLLSNPEWMKVYQKEKYLMQSQFVAEVAFDYADAMVKRSKL